MTADGDWRRLALQRYARRNGHGALRAWLSKLAKLESDFDDAVEAFHVLERESRADGLDGVPLDRAVAVTAHAMYVHEQTRQHIRKVGESALRSYDQDMREGVDLMRRDFKQLTERLAALDREQRMAARETPPSLASPPRVLCKACHRKEARLEGYCKRCARDNGIVVHGKIM